MANFVSAMCRRECCACGAPAAHKVAEIIFADDPNPHRPPLSIFLCHRHFGELMGPTACAILAGQRDPHIGESTSTPREKPAEAPKSKAKGEEPKVAGESEDRLPLLVGIGQAAELLGLGRSTIYKLIGTGTIRPTKIGNRTLIPIAAIHALAANGT